MRSLTEQETYDYLNGYRDFPGAVETEHGVEVPEPSDDLFRDFMLWISQ